MKSESEAFFINKELSITEKSKFVPLNVVVGLLTFNPLQIKKCILYVIAPKLRTIILTVMKLTSLHIFHCFYCYRAPLK